MVNFFKVLCMSLVIASSAIAAMDEVDAKHDVSNVAPAKAEVAESDYAKATVKIKAAVEQANKIIQDAADEALAELQEKSKAQQAPVAPVAEPVKPAQEAVPTVVQAENDEAAVKVEYTKLYQSEEIVLDYTTPSVSKSCDYWEDGTASALISTYKVQGDDGESSEHSVRLNFSCPTDLSTHPEECMVTVHLEAWRGIIELAPVGDDCKINFKNENGKLSGQMACKLALRDDSAKMGNKDDSGWQDISNAVFKLDVQNCKSRLYSQPAAD